MKVKLIVAILCCLSLIASTDASNPFFERRGRFFGTTTSKPENDTLNPEFDLYDETPCPGDGIRVDGKCVDMIVFK